MGEMALRHREERRAPQLAGHSRATVSGGGTWGSVETV